MEIFIAMSVFAFAMSITPGPNNLMLLSSGTAFGFKRSIPHVLGIVGGFLILFLCVWMGAIQIFSLIPESYFILKVFSVSYLGYLSYKSLNVAFKSGNLDVYADRSRPFSFFQAVLFQWINPKSWVMALTAISTYVSSPNTLESLFVASLCFVFVMLPSVSLWLLLGVQMQQFLRDSLRRKIFHATIAVLLLSSVYPILM